MTKPGEGIIATYVVSNTCKKSQSSKYMHKMSCLIKA